MERGIMMSKVMTMMVMIMLISLLLKVVVMMMMEGRSIKVHYVVQTMGSRIGGNKCCRHKMI